VGIEAREMLADDLAGLVAFEALRAGILAGHDAIRIEHVDGIVGDCPNQQLEALGVGNDVDQNSAFLVETIPGRRGSMRRGDAATDTPLFRDGKYINSPAKQFLTG